MRLSMLRDKIMRQFMTDSDVPIHRCSLFASALLCTELVPMQLQKVTQVAEDAAVAVECDTAATGIVVDVETLRCEAEYAADVEEEVGKGI